MCVYMLYLLVILFLSEFKNILHFCVCVRTCLFVYVCAQILVLFLPAVVLTFIKTDAIPGLTLLNDCEAYMMKQVSALFIHTNTLFMHTEKHFYAHKHAIMLYKHTNMIQLNISIHT
jgi:hypothetical protein